MNAHKGGPQSLTANVEPKVDSCQNESEHDLFQTGASAVATSVPLLTDDSQIGANLQVCADEENRVDWDQRG
jgi:hypothetical protein